MSRYAEMILPEFDQEMASTRKVLERVPEDKLEWKCHPKSNTIGWNANHIAEMAGWVAGTLEHAEFDVAPAGGPEYKSPSFKTRAEILACFDKNVAAARAAISKVSDDDMAAVWTLKHAGNTIFAMPRTAAIRGFVLNHIIHHRAILTVYLRMNDIPVPGLYGPSGDE
jgi:uncharacterized damage-inducible protein DinB